MPNVWEEGSEEEEAQWALGANAKSIGEHLWGYVRSDTVYRCWVVKWRILRQHKLVNSKQHVSEKTEPMFWEPGGEWRGSWLSEEYRRSFAAVLPISSWVFGKSAGAKKTFGDMNKARIYLDEQRIRGVDPVSKWVWSIFIQNLCILSRGNESNCYTRGNVTSWLCFDYCTRGAAQRRERSRSLLLRRLSRLRSKEVFSTDLISWRCVDTTRRGEPALFTR